MTRKLRFLEFLFGRNPQQEQTMNALQAFETSMVNAARAGGVPADRPDQPELHDLLELMGVQIGDRTQTTVARASLRRLSAGDWLALEGAPATSIHVVRTGSFKIFRTAEDGYEQVFGFAHRGDLLGCDALSADRHLMATVALENSSAYALSLPDFFALAQSLPAFDRRVMRAVANAMIDLTRLSDMMAAVAAEVRLARFLVHESRRVPACGQPTRCLRLQMTRRDIGSYLGVAHETISRSFAALAQAGLIEVEQRKVEVLDLDLLERFALGTRGPAKRHGDLPRAGRAAVQMAAAM